MNILREALPDVDETGADLARTIGRMFSEAAGDEPWQMPELPPDWTADTGPLCGAIVRGYPFVVLVQTRAWRRPAAVQLRGR